MTTTPSSIPSVSFWQALKFWLKLGFISFGGPAGQIAIMQRELVDDKRWISQQRFNHALNYCMVLPGPEAQQLATYMGWLMHRTPGALAAGGLFVLPSLFIMIVLSWVYLNYGKLPWVAALFWGVQCAVAAIVLHALWRVGSRSLPSWKKNMPVAGIFYGLAAISFIAIAVLKLSFLWMVGLAIVVGWLVARRWPQALSASGHGADQKVKEGAYLIDDDTPTPEHAKFSKAAMLRVLAIGIALWGVSFVALVLAQGWQATLTQMGWFFTKAALVTFGGAYSVLPYVVQSAVDHYHWLSPEQMMAGLALGETTPGPLIMIVAFVGYLGGAQAAGAWLGVAAACVATWFTFLPSFVFILAGGPFVETTHGKLGFTAPLKAISATVVGAIASLAVLFIMHTAGIEIGRVDWAAVALMLVAAWLLFRRNWGIVRVIAVCAALGLLRGFVL